LLYCIQPISMHDATARRHHPDAPSADPAKFVDLESGLAAIGIPKQRQ